MQISGGSPHRYYRCVSNRKRGVCTNRLSVRETLTRQRVLEAIGSAIASPEAVSHIRHRLASESALSHGTSQQTSRRVGRASNGSRNAFAGSL